MTKSPEEAQVRSPLYLDMVEDGVILLDRGGFFQAVLDAMRARMQALSSRRVCLEEAASRRELVRLAAERDPPRKNEPHQKNRSE